MARPISLSVFLPAYNEEKNIDAVVQAARATLVGSPAISAYEIIVVDDGSSDHTPEILTRLTQAYPEVRVVRHAHNQGYGAALQSGIHAAQYEYVFFTDADLQFDLNEIHNLLLHIPRYEAVIGYRAPRRDPRMRIWNARIWNLLNRTLFGLKVRDIDCAFKIFKRERIQHMVLYSKGAMINAEILLQLTRQGVVLKEVPVSHRKRLYGSPTGAKFSVIVRALRELFALYSTDLGPRSRKEFMKFAVVGVANTFLDAGTYIALTRLVDPFIGEMLVAKFCSFMLGTISSLLLNHYWTFSIRTPLTAREILRFYVSVSAGLIINVTSLYVLVQIFGMYDLFALAIATILTFITNYTLARVWVFKTRVLPQSLSYAR